MLARLSIFLGACVLGIAAPGVRAQVLDVFDGETLYEGGFLVTLGFDLARGDRLRRGSNRIPDLIGAAETHWRTTLAVQYGLRHDLQLGVALPYVSTDQDGVGIGADASGVGDLSLLGKWRFFRWDAPGEALNVSALADLSLPTGEDDATTSGMRIQPELQVGSGGVDPGLGLAATYEPGRWRFNAAGLYRFRTDTDGDHARLGDELIAEVEIGNRFWLEPYPGPFMRADIAARYFWQDESRQGARLPSTGSERATLAVTWAFRPRPALDLQAGVELPIWQRVNGTQLGRDWAVTLAIGYRF